MSNGRGKYSTVVVDNNQVYMWAVLYFTLSNEKLKLDELRKMAKESKVSNITKNKTENKPKKVSKKETQKEQISLFN